MLGGRCKVQFLQGVPFSLSLINTFTINSRSRTMNYQRIYDNIISNRKQNPLAEGYGESHHIVPRSLGGTDDKNNLVRITAREHFVCHCLLSKMYEKESFEWYKMNHALMMMKARSASQQRYFNSHLYEYLRENFSLVMSKSQTGNNNSQHGTRWIHSLSERKSRKIPKQDPVPDGWQEGRKINWGDKQSSIIGRTSTCKACGKEYAYRQNAVYCSKECRNGVKTNSLTGKEEEFIIAYKVTGSLNKALKQIGLPGAVGSYYHLAKKLLKNC